MWLTLDKSCEHAASTDAELQRRLAEVKALADPIQGWVDDVSGSLLYRLARFYSPLPSTVELGSWKGRSTIWLASALRDRGAGKLYAIDTWMGSPGQAAYGELLQGYGEGHLFFEFQANISRAGLSDVVVPMRSTTIDAAYSEDVPREIGLLFIDADHEYEAVLRDFEAWSPKVVHGGLIVFDDVPSWPGPTRLIPQLPGWYEQVGDTWNQCVLRKATR